MSAAPCAVEWSLMARDAEEARLERQEAEEAEALAGIKASMLAALLTADMKEPVRCFVWRTERLGAQTLDEAMGDVMCDDDVTKAILKALAAETPEAAAAREVIAAKYVSRYEGCI